MGGTQHLRAAQVSQGQWFQVFGAEPILGRTFLSEEDQKGAGTGDCAELRGVAEDVWRAAGCDRQDAAAG